ncbi:MAG: RloB family protein [Pseudonocardiaceae bacterium]
MSRRRRGSVEVGRAGSQSLAHRSTYAVFYVVAEGEGTECDYFDRLDKAYGPCGRFRIRMPLHHVRRNGLQPADVVEHACGLAGDPDIKQVWGLFDHDGRNNIDQVCSTAKRERIEVALSHPSFELWLLLHFQDFTSAAQGGESETITGKLRNAHSAFADYEKRNKRIDQSRFAALMQDDGIHNAVRRARRLSGHFAHETPSQRDPSTEVFRLIEALGIVPPAS